MAYSGNNILNRLSEALEITKDKASKPKTEATISFNVAQSNFNKAVERMATKDDVEYCKKVLGELKNKRSELIGKVSATYTAKNEDYYSKIKKLNEMISKLTGLIRDYESEKKDLEYHYDLDKSDIKRGSAQYTRLYWSNFTPLPGDSPYTDAGNTSGSADN